MRTLLAFLTFTSAVFAASDLPKNLLRYNMGALPVVQNSEGAWVSVAPESLDWNAPYAAVLGGDVGKTVDLSKAKTFVVDLGQVESIERFSLFSQSATGSLTVSSSPVFEDPQTGKWSELGSLTLTPGQATTLTATPADARYLKFVFSGDSKGIVGPMGAFGTLTFNDVRPADVLQPQDLNIPMYEMNYATPATDMAPTDSQPSQTTEALMALFDDDPATILNVTEPTTLTVDLGANREINSTYMSAMGGGSTNLVFTNDLNQPQQSPNNSAFENKITQTIVPSSGDTKDADAGSAQSARYVEITLTPNGTTPMEVNGLSLIGPVDPAALVFERQPGEDVGGAASSAAGPIRPLAPQNPRVTSE